MHLSRVTLPELDARIARPGPPPARAGILHIGLGNFHRAHQAVYLAELIDRGAAGDWGILGGGVMPADAAMRDALKAQDWLYTVVEADGAGERARVAGAMTGFAAVEPFHAGLRAAMADPGIRIVSLTVTEGGYFLDAGGRPDPQQGPLRADAADPERPGTAFGAIVAGLRDRRNSGARPFTVMSCDNLPHNGAVTRTLITALARAQDPALADWIEAEVAFPNAMVDRITPATTPTRAAYLERTYGVQDARPVFCEPFRQWVLEDSFSDGRPPLEEVGVEFVTDVTPYETMKIRVLNGGHAVLAYAAGLLGIEFVHDAMADPRVTGLLDRVEHAEILPVVPPVPGTDVADYYATVRSRFANPRVEDTVARLCFDGSNRQPKFILPSVADNLARGSGVRGLALVSALWCRYCMGTDAAAGAIPPNDPAWDRLQAAALAARETPARWLEMAEIYGDLGRAPPFREAFEAALLDLLDRGPAAVLSEFADAG